MSCHSTHVGVAITGYARAVTDLDSAQVGSLFHRSKREHKDAPDPTLAEAVAGLRLLQESARTDPRLDEATTERVTARLQQAINHARQGDLPDGRTWAATQRLVVDAELAQRALDTLVRSSAKHQRKNEERLAATFRKWRRTDDYEDIEAPDSTFHPSSPDLPSDKHTSRALRKLGFENYLAQRLPVFVYGTLRRGQGNDRLLNSAITERSEQAHIEGVAVYGADRGFPYAAEFDANAVTRGDMVDLSADADGDWSRQSLDRLEGFDSDRYSKSHYQRVIRRVTYVDATGSTRTREAWVYLAGPQVARSLRPQDVIEGGDWVTARNEHRQGLRHNQARFFPGGSTTYTRDHVVTAGTQGGQAVEGSAAASAAAFEALGALDLD
jgi:gamma-glutamylcyclotransferase (GGCT)/AIG2-like uncharacterized protein YtfP